MSVWPILRSAVIGLRRSLCLGNIRLYSAGAAQQNNLAYWMNLENQKSLSNCHKGSVVFDDNTELTYAGLAHRVGFYWQYLRKVLGIEYRDRILARTDKNVDSLALYLATVQLGAVYIPVNPGCTKPEMAYFLQDAAPKLLVSSHYEIDSAFTGQVQHVCDASMLAKEVKKGKSYFCTEPVEKDDLACICYTSGTTGRPKGAMITHGNLIWNARALIDVWRFTEDDVLLHFLPFYHVHGMFISLNCALMTGSKFIFRPKFTVDEALHYLPRSTVIMGVPTYYSRLLKSSEFNKDIIKSMRLFISGSAPMSPSLWQEFVERTGHRVLERYGMTEAAVITSNPYEPEGRIPGSVGKILDGGEMRLSAENMVEIRLPSVFKGYWRNPEKTQCEFTSDGFFRTGDLGAIDEKGYLCILGRGKDLIISGGLNVYPKEVEDFLDADDLVKESAVIGAPHPDFGEAVVAVCVPKDISAKEAYGQKNKLMDRLRLQLASYKLPKRFIFLDELPRNSMGKVQKKLMREQYKESFILES